MILDLFDIQAIRFGSFTLKSGMVSPFYIDLRSIISYPHLMRKLVTLLEQKVSSLSYDLICGIPYTAIPFATALSLSLDIPMIMRRKEAKAYGTKKIVEGHFQPGQKTLIIEDIVTSGGSVLESIESLTQEGLIVQDIAVVIDRGQGGCQRLQEKGFQVHALFTLEEILHTLHQANKINRDTLDMAMGFVEQNQVV